MKALYLVVGVTYFVFSFVFMFVNCNIVPVLSLLFISVAFPKLHQLLLSYLAEPAWLTLVYWGHRIGGLTPIFTGEVDNLLKNYRGSKVLISNHASFTDSFLIFAVGILSGDVGKIRAFAKKSLGIYLPVMGWFWKFLNFVFLERKFDKDRPNIIKQLKALAEKSKQHKSGSFWIVIFPEGTRLRPQKLKESQEYAKEKNLTVFQNVLVPRIKGFQITLNTLREDVDGVVDLTIGYPQLEDDKRVQKGKIRPSVQDLLFGGGKKWNVHVHVRVIPVKEIPEETEAVQEWMMKVFEEKDKLLTHFKQHGHFPGEVYKYKSISMFQVLANFFGFGLVAVSVLYFLSVGLLPTIGGLLRLVWSK